MEWLTNLIGELDRSPSAQAIFFALVVILRLGLDRWERQREMEQHRKRRMVRHG